MMGLSRRRTGLSSASSPPVVQWLIAIGVDAVAETNQGFAKPVLQFLSAG